MAHREVNGVGSQRSPSALVEWAPEEARAGSVLILEDSTGNPRVYTRSRREVVAVNGTEAGPDAGSSAGAASGLRLPGAAAIGSATGVLSVADREETSFFE